MEERCVTPPTSEGSGGEGSTGSMPSVASPPAASAGRDAAAVEVSAGHRPAVVATPVMPDEEAVVQPSKVVRLAVMSQMLLSELRHVELDEAARHRLAAVFNTSVEALRELLSEDLQREVESLELRVPDDPTAAELRVAQAQLVGWLEGLFHGIRTTIVAHQLASQEELAQLYRQVVESAREEREKDAARRYL